MLLPFSHEQYISHLERHPILIADDDGYKRDRAAGIALANGYCPEYAKTPEQAWTLLNTKKYDLLILDNSMLRAEEEKDSHFDYDTDTGLYKLESRGGNQGLQLLRRIRSTKALKDLDVIMYTGSGEKRQTLALRGIYIGNNLALLNEILRERSELYRNKEMPRISWVEQLFRLWDKKR